MPLHRRIFLQSHAPVTAKKYHRCGIVEEIIGSSTTTRVANLSPRCFNNSEHRDVRNRKSIEMNPRNPPIRIVVAMSGGVDSSVAAHLLLQINQQQNEKCYAASSSSGVVPHVEVMGLHMTNWNALDEDPDVDSIRPRNLETSNESTTKNAKRNGKLAYSSSSSNYNYNNGSKSTASTSYYCEASEKEYHDASSVAKHLSIPLHRVSFASEYWIQVFEPFIESIFQQQQQQQEQEQPSYEQAEAKDDNDKDRRQRMMLNPDFGCNTQIKFGTMKEYAADRLQADYVATGHYARLWHRDYYATSLMKKYSNSRVTEHSVVDAHHSDIDNAFYHWMKESSRLVGNVVLESISGLPEEEWILHNNDHTSTASSTSSMHCPMLIAGADTSKDQSYFLSGVKMEAFRNVIFPLGHLIKSDFQTDIDCRNSHTNTINHHPQSVRELARIANIPTATKRDSSGICFIGQRNFGNFISQYLHDDVITTTSSSAIHGASESFPRIFVDIDTGKVLGHHRGMMHYTLGQGAKIPGVFVRYFVCRKGGGRGDSNTIYVCNSTHHPALYTDELYVDFDSFNWIGLGCDSGTSTPPRPLLEGHSVRLLARTRHLQPLASCTVSWKKNAISSSGRKWGHIVVHFDKPIRAITPGQIVALYAGREGLICLGGGVIGGKKSSFFDRGMSVSLSDLHPSGHNDLSVLKYRPRAGL